MLFIIETQTDQGGTNYVVVHASRADQTLHMKEKIASGFKRQLPHLASHSEMYMDDWQYQLPKYVGKFDMLVTSYRCETILNTQI